MLKGSHGPMKSTFGAMPRCDLDTDILTCSFNIGRSEK